MTSNPFSCNTSMPASCSNFGGFGTLPAPKESCSLFGSNPSNFNSVSTKQWIYTEPKPALDNHVTPRRIWCDLCGDNELVRKSHYKCTQCPDKPGFDVCVTCFNKYKYSEHFNEHRFISI